MQGIMFQEELFHATVEGRKTQTRRIVKQPEGSFGIYIEQTKEGVITGVYGMDANEGNTNPKTDQEWVIKPRYKYGETVYLKEPYFEINEFDALYKFNKDHYKYIMEYTYNEGIKWENKMFMPARCTRYFIKITNVWCERVRDISESDCIAEGIKEIESGCFEAKGCGIFATPKEAYKALWIKINGKESWDENPFVWVYEYELVKN